MRFLSVQTPLWPRALVVLVLLLAPGCARPVAHEEAGRDVDHLLVLMRQRLVIMHDVARGKWNSQAPISDPAREQAILTDIVARGRPHDLDPAFVRAFFTAQFEAAKRLQEDDFRRWQTERPPPFTDVPDLATELRPRIDRLNGELLTALAVVRPLLRDANARAKLQQKAATILTDSGITDDIRATAIAPLVRSAQ